MSKSKVIAVLAAASPCDVGARAAGATLSVGLGAATSSQFISAKVTTFQHRLADGAATVQGIEDRDAVRSADAGPGVVQSIQFDRRRAVGKRWRVEMELATVASIG